MPTTNCPNCGKPLRPGARFCGNCGATIPVASQAATATPQVEPDAFPCENCGKLVRPGAKFCTHCGLDLSKRASETSSQSTIDQPVAQMTARTGVLSPAGGSAMSKQTQTSTIAAAPKPKRRAVWPFLLIGIVLLCLLGVAGGLFLFRDPFNVIKPASPSQVAVIPVNTSTATEEVVVQPTSPATETSVVPSNTPEPSPTETPQPTETLNATPGVTVTVEITKTSAPISGSPNSTILLEDEFSESLSTNWRAWGDPLPTLKKGFGDSWLDLKAADKPGDAGTTTREEITPAPGIWLVLEAQLNPTFPQFPLIFDWDPVQFIRGPSNTVPTTLHFEILRSRILLLAPVTNDTCDIELDGTTKHAFSLFFLDEQTVELFIDDSQQSLCRLDLGVVPGPGKISFTGNGWVTRIKVSDAPIP